MPQIDPIAIKNGNIYIWEITETKDSLLRIYGKALPDEYEKYKSLSHQKQFIVRQILLNKLNIEKIIHKNIDGKPLLDGKKHVSISHTNRYVAVAISSYPIGIDIEKKSKKIILIAPKFIDNKCLFVIKRNKDEIYQIIWSAKESIYKLMSIKGLSFKNDIIIKSIDQKRRMGEAEVQQKTKTLFRYKKIDKQHIIVWAV